MWNMRTGCSVFPRTRRHTAFSPPKNRLSAVPTNPLSPT